MALKALSQNFLDFIRVEDQLAGLCPLCNQLIRVSEMELFYIPDRKDDVLRTLRDKERELTEQEKAIRADACEKKQGRPIGESHGAGGPAASGLQT